MMTAIIIFGLIGLVIGVILTFGSSLFKVDKDEKFVAILETLPGVNCGACGFAGCAGLAQSITIGNSTFSGCSVMSDDDREEAAERFKISSGEVATTSAVLLCNGGVNCLDSFEYDGVKDCQVIADTFGNTKACSYGCIGEGTCMRACPFDVISMGKDGLPHIDEKNCVSCYKCVVACPLGLIQIQDISKGVTVVCSSKDKGAATKKVCSAGCIGCKICEKKCGDDAIHVNDYLSSVDRDKCTDCQLCVEPCPSKVIFKNTANR